MTCLSRRKPRRCICSEGAPISRARKPRPNLVALYLHRRTLSANLNRCMQQSPSGQHTQRLIQSLHVCLKWWLPRDTWHGGHTRHFPNEALYQPHVGPQGPHAPIPTTANVPIDGLGAPQASRHVNGTTTRSAGEMTNVRETSFWNKEMEMKYRYVAAYPPCLQAKRWT